MNAPGPGAAFDDWVERLGEAPVPVLRESAIALESLRVREDEVIPRELSKAILRDPLLTLIVLRFLQVHRPSRRIVDITTIEHGVMMIGIGPFFRQFRDFAVVEDVLQETPLALHGLNAVVSRARHAAMHACRWAELRGDVETDEVVIAALLHDLAEMLLWVFAPQSAMRIAQRLNADTGLRSAIAQQEVLGFTLAELQQALCRAWQLPELLLLLMDDQQVHRPRAQNVLLAVALARHAAHGWWDAALPDDYQAIKAFLRLPDPVVMEEIFRTSVAVAAEQAYADPRLAAWLPPPPTISAAGRQESATHGSSGGALVERAMALLEARSRTGLGDWSGGASCRLPVSLLARTHALAVAMHAIHAGCRAECVLFLEREGECLAARFVVGNRSAAVLRNCRIPAGDDRESWPSVVQAQMGNQGESQAIAVPVRREGEIIGVLHVAGMAGADIEDVRFVVHSIVAAVESAMP